MTDAMKQAIDAVRQHARRNYSVDGWDYVIETLDSVELEGILGDVTNPKAAIRKVGKLCKSWDNRRKEIFS